MRITPDRSYLVCATQRSGSTLLCELLKSTGVAGRPEEYFEAERDTGIPPHPARFLEGLTTPEAVALRADDSPPEAPTYSSLRGLSDYRVHLQRTLRAGTTDNGVFGAKLMFNQLPALRGWCATLPEYAGLESIPLVRALFGDPVFVWISREDTVGQAVSMWTALQTRRWRGSRTPPERDAPLVYSFAAIDHLTRSFAAAEHGWSALFAAYGIEPVHIGYEADLERDRTATTMRVLAALAVVAPPGWTAPEPLPRQAGSRSAEWVAAYHRDLAARAAL